MKTERMKWLAALLVLASCAPMMETVRQDKPCPEAPGPVTTHTKAKVAIAAVYPTGEFRAFVVDAYKKEVLWQTDGKTHEELHAVLDKARVPDYPDQITLELLLNQAGDLSVRPLPLPNPPGTDLLALASRVVSAYELSTLSKAPAPQQQPTK